MRPIEGKGILQVPVPELNAVPYRSNQPLATSVPQNFCPRVEEKGKAENSFCFGLADFFLALHF
jgi:hypothetical protein